MSADNWAVCPRCLANEQQKWDESVKAVEESYGKVSIEEFESARAAIPPERPSELSGLKETFREDYEIYEASSGVIKVSYSGHCGTCGLGLNFSLERPIPGVPGEDGDHHG